MKNTEIEVKILKKDFDNQIDPCEIDDVIYIENDNHLHVVSQIKLSGKYERNYILLTDYIPLQKDCVCLYEDILLIGINNDLIAVDIKNNKIIRIIEIEYCIIFGIYKFKSGYFVYGEETNCFINKNFEIVWTEGCGDIFVNYIVADQIEFTDDYIAVYDWIGYKHYYNERGEFKTEYYRHLDCNKS